MKTIKVISLILLTLFFTNTIKSQVLKDSIPVMISPNTKDLIIITKVKAALTTTSDIRYIGFCSNHNVFLLYISRSVYGSANNFVSTIKINSGVNSLIVKNGKMNEILKACSFSDPTEAGLVKLRYGK